VNVLLSLFYQHTRRDTMEQHCQQVLRHYYGITLPFLQYYFTVTKFAVGITTHYYIIDFDPITTPLIPLPRNEDYFALLPLLHITFLGNLQMGCIMAGRDASA
jgi:hypothetical protein